MTRRTGLVRRSALVGGALVMAFTATSISALSAQAKYNPPPPPGTGITRCNGHWSGVMDFPPGLTNGGKLLRVPSTVSLTAARQAVRRRYAYPPFAMKIKGSGTITAT